MKIRNQLVAASLLAVSIASLPAGAHAAPEVGKPAPDFTVGGADGKTHTLAEYRGKYVVLEWLNHGCPYVRKHYDTQSMQTLQKDLTDKGVVWLSVISSAPGQQGHATAEKAAADVQSNGAHPTVVLLDEKGDVGRLYDAKTTPQMFLVGPDGALLYKGAIDDQPTFSKDSIASAKNYVRQAATESMGGSAVSEPSTTPYGCSVKY